MVAVAGGGWEVVWEVVWEMGRRMGGAEGVCSGGVVWCSVGVNGGTYGIKPLQGLRRH